MHVFVEVVESGSLTAAGRVLGVPKSTVSRQLSALEGRLGVQLVQRTTRSLALTEAGAAYFERVRRMVGQIEDAEAAIGDLAAEPRGVLRVTAPVTLGQALLGPVVGRFAVRFPAVLVHVELTDRVVHLVDERFDVALRAGRLADSTSVARRLRDGGLCVCASPDYLAAHGRPQRPADLLGHDGLVNEGTPWRDRWSFAGGEVVTVRRRLSSTSWDVLRHAALAGLGVCQVPVMDVEADLAAGRLERVLEDHAAPRASLWVVTPGGAHLPSKVRAFVDHVVAELGAP